MSWLLWSISFSGSTAAGRQTQILQFSSKLIILRNQKQILIHSIQCMENALKEVDEDYECKSLSKVTPFSYTDSEGNIITYYCCQTSYLSDQSGEYTGLNTDAIGMVIDFAQINNRRECKVNAYAAFQCEMGERSYLCWTISPEISCIIEYSAEVNNEEDIFQMAKSVLG